MPEVTTCPACDKKLKVPDNLIGKKVRCPGCAGMFTAKAEGAGGGDFDAVEDEREEKTKAKAGASRKDAISDRKGSPRRDDEDEPPRGRKGRDEEEPPRAKKGRDEEDDRPRARSKRDEDEDDRRPSRRDEERDRPRNQGVTRLDEVDDRRGRSARDDDRPSRRDRRDEEDDYDRRPSRSEVASGWRGTRIGLLLVVISNWIVLGAAGLWAISMGLIMFLGASLLMDFMAGPEADQAPGAKAGGAVLIVLGFVGVIGLWSIAELLKLIGMGLCIMVPTKRGPTLRILAGVALGCMVLGLLLGTGNAAVGGHSAIQGGSGLLQTVGFICFIIFLRMVATELGDEALGMKFLIFMIAVFVFAALAAIMIVIAACAGAASIAGSKDAGQGAERAGSLIVVMWSLMLLLVALFCALLTWYSVLLQRLRGVITGHVGE